MKCLILNILLLTSAGLLYGQSKKQEVYYLADTLSANASNNILTIDKEGPLYGYLFHCRCIKENNAFYVGFVYDMRKATPEKFSQLPQHKYLSWKELENMLYEKQRQFDLHFSLHIVEKLPDGSFMKNEVRLLFPNGRVTH